MSDTMTAGVVDASVNSGGATETKEPVDSQGQGSVAPEASKEAGDQAEGSQEAPQGGSEENPVGRNRRPSVWDTIKQLRQEKREQRQHWEKEVGGLKTQLEDLNRRFQAGPQEKKPSKTFWEAPEEVMDERFDSKLTAMERRLLERLDARESQSQQTSEWKQETSEATKFIQTQKGITPEDEEDIAEFVRSTPEMAAMRPLQRAKYALFLWKEERGIGDRSAAKARAAVVVGAGGNSTPGLKTWTESEMTAEIEKLPPDPKNWSDDQKKRFDFLDTEFKRAAAEGRVKK